MVSVVSSVVDFFRDLAWCVRSWEEWRADPLRDDGAAENHKRRDAFHLWFAILFLFSCIAFIALSGY